MLTNHLYDWVAASADTSHSPIDTSCSLIASVPSSTRAGVDVMGWRDGWCSYPLARALAALLSHPTHSSYSGWSKVARHKFLLVTEQGA
jgi:hypothetical protein